MLAMEGVRKRFKTWELKYFVHFRTFKKYTIHDFKTKIVLINSDIDLQKYDMFTMNIGFCSAK